MKLLQKSSFVRGLHHMCRSCHKYKPERFLNGFNAAPTKRDWCFCMWKLAIPRERLSHPEWITVPTCAACVKKHYKPLYPSHPCYPKNPRPGDLFFIDDMGGVLRFGGLTGPPSTRPHPKDVELEQKKVADYIKEKQAQRDKELEESNKVAEAMLAKDQEDAAKSMLALSMAKVRLYSIKVIRCYVFSIKPPSLMGILIISDVSRRKPVH